MFLLRFIFIVLLAWVVRGGELRKEGPFWVETIEGSETVAPHGRLRVMAQGSIVFRGAEQGNVVYTYKRRVRAGSEAEAQAALRGGGVRNTRRGDITSLTILDAPRSGELRVSCPRDLAEVFLTTKGGSVDAAGLNGNLRAEAGAGKIGIHGIGGNVEIRTAGGPTDIGSIKGTVQCFSGGGPIHAGVIGGGALFESGGGDIILQQVDGPVRAFTEGGAIHITRAGDTVMANTGGGPIQVDRASGMVIANNAGGPIQIGHAPGVRCESASGAIRVNNISGSVRASTGEGSIVAQYLKGLPALDSFLSTGSGDITVLIPSNLRVTVRAKNEASGNIRTIVSEFKAISVRSEGAAVIGEGRINGGGPLLHLAGNGGIIYIKKGN